MTPTYYFLHSPSGRCWPTADPRQWLLDHRDDDLLAPARERLLTSPEEAERCLRAVLRRCNMVFVRVVTESQVVVRYWSGTTPDIRTWAKTFGWNRLGVQVALIQEKAGKVVVYRDGQDVLLHGQRVGPEFPWSVYAAKYGRRGVEEQDDLDVAPASFTNFEWEGEPHDRLGWRVLKAVWNAEGVNCPNCDVPLVVVSFDWQMGPLSFRAARVVRHCQGCHRRFEFSEEEPLAWLASVLPPPLRPIHLLSWKLIPVDWRGLSLSRGPVMQVAGQDG